MSKVLVNDNIVIICYKRERYNKGERERDRRKDWMFGSFLVEIILPIRDCVFA